VCFGRVHNTNTTTPLKRNDCTFSCKIALMLLTCDAMHSASFSWPRAQTEKFTEYLHFMQFYSMISFFFFPISMSEKIVNIFAIFYKRNLESKSLFDTLM